LVVILNILSLGFLTAYIFLLELLLLTFGNFTISLLAFEAIVPFALPLLLAFVLLLLNRPLVYKFWEVVDILFDPTADLPFANDPALPTLLVGGTDNDYFCFYANLKAVILAIFLIF
jgi:hypothetical protein